MNHATLITLLYMLEFPFIFNILMQPFSIRFLEDNIFQLFFSTLYGSIAAPPPCVRP